MNIIDKIIEYRIIRDVWTLFETEEVEKRKDKIREKQEVNDGLIKDIIIRDTMNFFEQQEKDYYKLKRNECLNKIKPYLRDIIIDLQNSVAWKIQLIIAMNFISSRRARNALKEREYKIYIL